MIGIFIFSQSLFILLDGTIIAPKVNKYGDVAGKFIEKHILVDTYLFYESRFFNIVTVVGVILIVFHLTKDMITHVKKRKNTQQAE